MTAHSSSIMALFTSTLAMYLSHKNENSLSFYLNVVIFLTALFLFVVTT